MGILLVVGQGREFGLWQGAAGQFVLRFLAGGVEQTLRNGEFRLGFCLPA